jgi:hypothetical protein
MTMASSSSATQRRRPVRRPIRLILEEDGRLCVRLAPIAPAAEGSPWQSPIAIRAGFKWEPARALGMRPNELAETVLAAFVRSVEGLARS